MIFLSPLYTKAINNAVASVEMEGFAVTDECKALCEKLLDKTITFEEYLEAVKKSQGIA